MHLDPPRHLFHFDRPSARTVIERAGLTVTGISGVSFEHDPYGWAEGIASAGLGGHNILTRYLMGLDDLTPKSALGLILGAVMVLPALALSLASWSVGQGALFEIQAGKGE